MAKISFYGATETVTGSKYLLETGRSQVLIDCGMFQGLKALRLLNWEPLPFNPTTVDAVVLTHAHIDHTGCLPRLVRYGFSGPIYCTTATEPLSELLLLDAARNQENDAEYANRKHFSKHHPALPLFDTQDVNRTIRLFQTVHRNRWFTPAPDVRMRFHNVGHLLGASMIEVEIHGAGRPLRLLFSGDVGRYQAPLYFDPETPPECDYLICESTYGDREHSSVNVLDELADVVNESAARGGMMLLASFAVGRAAQLIYLLQILMDQKRIPRLTVFLDSPMAVRAMHLYGYYASEHDLEEGYAVRSNFSFAFSCLSLVRSVEESKQINLLDGPGIIISSSGMMTGGRILHHLRRRLPNSRNTVVLAGFTAAGTRGRDLQDGAKFIRIFGTDVPVRAKVVSISALSGHAGHSELRRWLEPLAPPRQTFITHGERNSAQSFARELQRERHWNTTVPKLGESFELT